MNINKSFIDLQGVRSFYISYCKEKNKKFTERECDTFVDCCERDFFEWLRENLRYFESEIR